MPLIGEDRLQPRLDERLADLATGIIERIGVDPPSVRLRLQPPQLTIKKGPRGLNSFCLPGAEGTKRILVGADLYEFLLRYTRAAATYFLPDRPKGPRPSRFWSDARSALATTLDWLSSPATTLVYPRFETSNHQAQAAKAIADYAYQFNLCHEMAHIALGHQPQRVGEQDTDALHISQEQELSADRFGLEMQFRSLPDATQVVNGLAGAIYLHHALGLVAARLSLLSGMVDEYRWTITHTHPPALARIFALAIAAEGLRAGSGEGLRQVHHDLAEVDQKFLEAAEAQQSKTVATMRQLIQKKVARNRRDRDAGRRLDTQTSPGGAARVRGEAEQEVRRLLDRSPLGVLRALEPAEEESPEDDPTPLIVEDLASLLPPEFQSFRSLSKADRAEKIA